MNAGSPLVLANGGIPSPNTQLSMQQAMATNAQNVRPLAGQAGQQITMAKIQQLFQSGAIPRSTAQTLISQLAVSKLQQQQGQQQQGQPQQQPQSQPQQPQQPQQQQQQQQQHMGGPQPNTIQFQNALQATSNQTSKYNVKLFSRIQSH